MPEELFHGPDGPRRVPPRWVVVAGVLVVVVAVSVVLVTQAVRRDGSHPTASPSSPGPSPIALGPLPTVPPGQVVGLVIGSHVAAGGAIERRDPGAAAGPWTVVVRRRDGALGRHGAVVTFPVPASRSGVPVTVGSVTGTRNDHAVVWPLDGKHARVRGDLPVTQLTAIAAHTTVAHGRPVVHAPAGLTAVAKEPYRSIRISEARYGGDEMPDGTTLGGLVYTGVARGGGFEDRLYATGATKAGTVHGKPAVASPVLGGNGSLA